jgi:hypothetical protein
MKREGKRYIEGERERKREKGGGIEMNREEEREEKRVEERGREWKKEEERETQEREKKMGERVEEGGRCWRRVEEGDGECLNTQFYLGLIKRSLYIAPKGLLYELQFIQGERVYHISLLSKSHLVFSQKTGGWLYFQPKKMHL